MKLIKKLFIPLCLTVATMVGITACSALEPIEESTSVSISVPDPITYTLNLTSDKTTAKRGDVVTLAAYLHSEEAEDELAENAVFSIVEGASAATLSGNKLTISNSAAANTVIKVKAKIGITDSNVVEIKVDVPLEGVSISAGDATNILAGASLTLTKTIYPEGADTSALEWKVTEGASYASFNGDVLVVSDKAPTGAIIKVKAVSGDIASKELSFIVGYPLTGLSIAQPEAKNVLSGSQVKLNVTATPANTTEKYTWEFVEGSAYADVVNDYLTVKADAPTGVTIKVKAVCGSIETETVSFIVGYPLEGLKIEQPEVKNVTSSAPVELKVTATPANTTEKYSWEFVEGGQYATVNVTNNKEYLTVNANAPTGATIKVKAVFEDIETEVLTFIVGYPLDSLTIEEPATKNILSGNSITLKVTASPSYTTETYTWEFVEGGAHAIINNNILTVNNGVATGEVITIKAVCSCGNHETQEVSFVVGYPLTDLKVSVGANVQTNVSAGTEIDLIVTKTPSNTTNGDYTWNIVEGSDYATIVGDKLIISEDTPFDTDISVQAVGAVESNVLSFVIGVPITALTISSDAPTLLTHGASYNVSVSAEPSHASTKAVQWAASIDGLEGNWATFANGQFTVSSSVPHGATMKVTAFNGDVVSNELSFQVGIALTGLTVTMNGSTNVDPGDTRQLTVARTPDNTTDLNYTWAFEKGASYCTIVNNELKVNKNAPIGAEIVFYATNGSVESDPITVIVGIPVEDISISIGGETKVNIDPNNTKYIDVVFTPNNASVQPITWVFEKGQRYCTISNSNISINSNAPIGAEIVVQAKLSNEVTGDVLSNKLTIIVGVPATGISISIGGKTEVNVEPNASETIDVVLTPNNATAQKVEWVFEQGKDLCSISPSNVLKVNSNATIGATIVVKAKIEYESGVVVTSAPITITVGIPVESVSIALVGSANIDPNQSRPISVSVNPTNYSKQQEITWGFDAGEEYCTIVNNTITINSGVSVGTQIIFYAMVGGHTSNKIAVTVGTPITGITLNPEVANGSEVERGTRFDLNVSLQPAGANAAYSWNFIEGGDWVEVVNNKLVINANTPAGTIVKLQAVSGDVTSATLTYTVTLTEKEENATKYYISLSGENFTVDKNATSATTLKVELYNYNYEKVTDKEFTFKVIEGSNFVAITANGAVCTFQAIGHGQAFVEISVAGITEQVAVNAIVPPNALLLPDVFRADDRTNFAYNFSMYDHNSSNGQRTGYDLLPFVATVGISDNNMYPCSDVVYTFRHADGTTGDEVATYADGKITFKKLGLITVTATSNSGSRLETTVSYTFNINDGYNVYSFKEASDLVHYNSGFYNGQIVNFVALDFLVGEDGKEYGYAFVPETALEKQENQTFDEVRNSYNNRIIAVNCSLYVNGNKHTIDASNLRIPSSSEITAHLAAGGKWINHGGLLSAEPYTNDGSDVVGDFFVKIYDVTVKGNSDINYENKEKPGEFEGGYNAGINVGNLGREGSDTEEYSAKYYVDIKNVEASGFKAGFKLIRVVEGTVENAYAHNCYQNGFAFRSSIIKMKNLKLGECGAVGIELTPEGSNTAGIHANQPQTVTFEGTLDVEKNGNTMNTSYLKTYTVMGYTIPQIVAASLSVSGIDQSEDKLSHVQNKDGEVCLITFIIDLSLVGGVSNSSQALYPSYQEGGIIDATDLPANGIDTEHQFIRLTAALAPGLTLGSVLLYNYNYGK